MAEQAVNTIYLLGEQPDALCGDIIKDFARRVFASKGPTPSTSAADVEPLKSGSVAGSAPPSPSRERSASEEKPADTTGAFLLSQLVFLVGHVAFKHIVYLELVEREIKRRKEVLAKGSTRCPTF